VLCQASSRFGRTAGSCEVTYSDILNHLPPVSLLAWLKASTEPHAAKDRSISGHQLRVWHSFLSSRTKSSFQIAGAAASCRRFGRRPDAGPHGLPAACVRSRGGDAQPSAGHGAAKGEISSQSAAAERLSRGSQAELLVGVHKYDAKPV
jgi:hypothetical protein